MTTFSMKNLHIIEHEEPANVTDEFLFEKGVLYKNNGGSFIQVLRDKKIKSKAAAISAYTDKISSRRSIIGD